MKKICLLLVTLMFAVSDAWAGGEPVKIGEVVVSATKLEEHIEEVASSVTVITEEEIREKQSVTVADAIENVPGLDVVRSGNLTNIYLRGTGSGHTLILIDGIEMNDPLSPSREYDYLSTISTENIERIEIIRGPQSTL